MSSERKLKEYPQLAVDCDGKFAQQEKANSFTARFPEQLSSGPWFPANSYGKFLIQRYTLFLKLVGVNSPVAVAVCDFPSGHTEPMVKMGEQLNLLSE
ncbi:hypothetical protein lerEdw1_016871 [Lerista edwardsae]|nr:hypothetical protein lerEdw1_016871 [Lerista edwardsae]